MDNFINPFAKQIGGDVEIFTSETAYAANELDYPILRKLTQKVESVFSTAESSITRPNEAVMGPPLYPPSTRQPPQYNIPEIQASNFRGGYSQQHDGRFNLPLAQSGQGAILILPYDIGQYADVISRWESITLNIINEKHWTDNKSKIIFIENLLGDTEKKRWMQWRMAFTEEYEALTNMADDPQNIISHRRRMFLLEDPITGSTEEQDRAYNDLERLTCNNVKDLFDYMNDYKVLAAKSGRLYISPELSEKFFRKMPLLIGKELERAYS